MMLSACSGGILGKKDSAQLPPTDTFPSFYGEVPTNLLIISVDTFRRDHMGRYGDTRSLTPFLDSLMEQGVALDNHRSCSNWTYPGAQCAMDGYSGLDLGQIPDFSRTPLPDRVTLGSAMKDAGYFTVMITSNGWLYDDTNVAYGFDYADHPSTDKAINLYEIGRNKLYENIDPATTPWFLHVHFKEPHTPYNPPGVYLEGLEDLPELDYDLTDFDQHYDATAEWDALDELDRDLLMQHLVLRYTGEMRYLDDQIRSVFVDLTARGLLDDTLVIFWSDHGEQFYEHGRQAHALALYGEENDALGFYWADNIVPAAVTIPTTHQDLAPTALELLGIAIPTQMTGIPASQLTEGRAVHSYTAARLGTIQTLVQDDHKLIYTWSTGDKELYDLVADPGELTDLYDSTDSRVISMWETMLPLTERIDEIRDNEPLNPGP
ncbi:MAG: arylsulfatase [Myxococcota bacterium]|jgi:arylsulfatase